MKRIYFFLCAVLFALQLQAVPAMPGKRIFTNPDGTTVEYEVRGDEFYHFMIDANDNILEENAAGFLTVKEKLSMDSVAARRARSKAPSVERIRKAGTVNLAPRGLFILVNFKDTKYQSSNTLAAMTEMINSTGHTYNFDGSPGSVRDYYLDQSDGQYNPQFDVYGPVTVSQNSSYYAGSGGTDNAYKMVIEACQSLNSQIDFSLYDGDNDGFVDFVYVIYAGKGQADGGGTSTIWPHQWYIYSGAGQTVELDGKKLDNYACGGELNGQTGHRYGIGTLCHEFGHVLGLPDYYDTNYGYNSTYGRTPGDWHIMDGGSYNNNGINPPNYAAHDKYFLGWYTPTILKDPENVTLPADGKTYRMINAAQTQQSAKSTNTIYYLENRQQTGWDAYLPGHGMLVWKVTYNASVWQNNRPNYSQKNTSTGANLYYTVASATGSLTNIGKANDPFPGTDNVTSYTPISRNALTDIEESNKTIYFKFNGGITRTFTVSFNAGEHATCTTSSLTQSAIGATITLPDVNVTTPYYKFVGWSATEGSVTAEIGTAGDTYIPTHDITLYAVVVPDGYWVRFYTETLSSTIGHGSCNVTDMRENGEGAGILLPDVVADPGYAFQFWVFVDDEGDLDVAGSAGETFYPMRDSMILYSYVYPMDSVYLSYTTYKVEQTSGPEKGWIKQGQGFTATFVAASGYTLESEYAQIKVTVDGEELTGATTLENGVLTVSLTDEQTLSDITIKVVAAMEYEQSCTDYSYTYSQLISETTQVLNDVTWNITVSNSSAAISYDSQYGEMFGTSSIKTGGVQYITSAFNDCDIQSVVLTCGHASTKNTGSTATVKVFINGTQIGSQNLSRNTNTSNNRSRTLTFTNSNNLKGEVRFTITNTSGNDAFYVKTINVNVNIAPDPNAPQKLEVGYMQALNYTSGSRRVWQVQFEPMSTDYPSIMTAFEGNDLSSISGTHETYFVEYALVEGDELYAEGRPTCTLAYVGPHPEYTSYPQYHVNMAWEDETTHKRYYIDSDVLGQLIDYDAYENGDDYNITPTGDTNPVYYTVRHLLQNTNDDGYTLAVIDTLQTKAGTTLTPSTRSFSGFYYPATQTKTVNTSYATVFEYKYDRQTFPVNFIVDGTVWQTSQVRYGATPTYVGETPDKQPSAEYTYTFTGWVPTWRPVRQADNYTAQFSESAREYTITWIVNGESSTTSVAWGTVPTAPEVNNYETASTVYTFTGWDAEIVAVSGEATYTAQFSETAREYTITWIINGESSTTSVAWGTVPTAPEVNNYETESTVYTFTGWDAEIVAVSGEATYTAQFSESAREYTITWIVNGVSSTTSVAWGTVPTAPEVNNYETASTVYTFTGWDTEIVAVSGEATYTAQFSETAREYTIIFANEDGTPLQTSDWAYGETPEYTGETPTKPADAAYTYTFAGWTPEVTAVTGEATYTATYTATPNTPTGIEQVIVSGNSISGPQGLHVYDLVGHDVTGMKDHLTNGTYIIVLDGQARKVIIR